MSWLEHAFPQPRGKNSIYLLACVQKYYEEKLCNK